MPHTWQSVRSGDFSNAWVDRMLCEHDCPILPGAARPAPVVATANGVGEPVAPVV